MTAEFVAAKLNLARLPGAKAAFLKTLRSGLTWRGLQVSHVNALRAGAPDGTCADTCHLGQARQVSFGRACRGSAMFAPKRANLDI